MQSPSTGRKNEILVALCLFFLSEMLKSFWTWRKLHR